MTASTSGQWSQQAYIKASNTDHDDQFGFALSLTGDEFLVGAPEEDSGPLDEDGMPVGSASRAGAAYLFERENSEWRQTRFLKAINAGRDDAFGRSVALTDGLMLIGAPFEWGSGSGLFADSSDNSSQGTGASYLYRKFNGEWNFTNYMKASDSAWSDQFGRSVAISGEQIAIGAPYEDGLDDRKPDSGAAYAFSLPFDRVCPPFDIVQTLGATRLIVEPPPPGRRLGVEYSTDLSTWIQIGNFFNSGTGTWTFVDPDQIRRARPAGYYRAFLRPLQ